MSENFELLPDAPSDDQAKFADLDDHLDVTAQMLAESSPAEQALWIGQLINILSPHQGDEMLTEIENHVI